MENTSGQGKAKNQANIKADRIKTHLLLEGGGGGRVGQKSLHFPASIRRSLTVGVIAIHNMVMRYVRSLWPACGKRR